MFGKNDPFLKGAALAFRDDAALYAELYREDGGYALVSARRIDLPAGLVADGAIIDGASLGEYLIKSSRLSWHVPLALGIPSARCIFKTIAVPAGSPQKAREYVRWNFSSYFSVPYEDVFSDVSVMSASSDGNTRCMAAVCPKAQLAPLLEKLYGLDRLLCAMEPQIVAGVRALTDKKDDNVLLALRSGTVAEFAFIREGEPAMFRSRAVHDMQLFPAEFCAELQRTKDQVMREFDTAPRVLLAGGAEMCGVSAEEIGAEFRRAEDVYPLRFTPPAQSDWYDVAGLLLRFIDEDLV